MDLVKREVARLCQYRWELNPRPQHSRKTMLRSDQLSYYTDRIGLQRMWRPKIYASHQEVLLGTLLCFSAKEEEYICLLSYEG